MGVLTKIINVVTIILSLTLGFFFVFVGLLKLTPAVKEDTHEELQKEFIRMAKVFPLADVLDFKMDPDIYRMAVGVLELVCGTMLALAPGCLRDLASILLLVTMTGAAYSHHALNDDVDKMTPSLVCGALLLLRLITSKLLCSSDRARCQKKPAAATEMHTKSE